MQFQVPQFLEIEDKIFGPLTFKQFLYLAGGGGISFVIFKSVPVFFAILLIAPIVVLAVALAFYRVNNKPFIIMLESAVKYAGGGKLYIWKKGDKKKVKAIKNITPVEESQIPRLSDSKLRDIAWSLGVKESVYAEQVDEQDAHQV